MNLLITLALPALIAGTRIDLDSQTQSDLPALIAGTTTGLDVRTQSDLSAANAVFVALGAEDEDVNELANVRNAVSSSPGDSECFDRFSDIWSPSAIGPSEAQCRSAVQDGGSPQLRRLGEKLRESKRCLTIVVIGGSITAGHGALGMDRTCDGPWGHLIARPKLPKRCAALCEALPSSRRFDMWYKYRCGDSVLNQICGREAGSDGNWCLGATTYWGAMKHALDDVAPCVIGDDDSDADSAAQDEAAGFAKCDGLELCPMAHRNAKGHRVLPYANSGVGTGFWNSHLMTSEVLRTDIRNADLILVDTAVNDGKETKLELTEILVWQLERIAPRASKMWATVGFRSPGGEKAVSTELGQRKVLARYGIPQISMIQGLRERGPSGVIASTARKASIATFPNGFTQKFIPNYPSNCCHPGNLGTQLVATFIVRYMLRLRDENDDAAAAVFAAPTAPQWATAKMIDEYTRPPVSYLHLACTVKSALADAHVMERTDFDVFEDAKNKPGLISSTVGARFIVAFPVEMTEAAKKALVTNGLAIAISLLSSYAHVGVAELSLQMKEEVNVVGTTKQWTWTTVLTKTVDCLWKQHASEPTVHRLKWKAQEPFAEWMDLRGMLQFRVVVTVAPSSRTSTKVKVYSIDAYSIMSV